MTFDLSILMAAYSVIAKSPLLKNIAPTVASKISAKYLTFNSLSFS